MEEPKYKIIYGEYDDSLLKKVVDLFTDTFYWTKKFTMEYLRWQYIDNPNGKVVSYNAFAENGELAAHYAAIPIYMLIDGKKERGLLSLNTATHPNHQGHRLFTRLADETYNYASENGYKFVIGVANANSTHGFLKYLKFDFVAPLEFKIGIGDIFKDSIPDNLNRVLYDKETLLWRLKCPEYKYTTAGNTIHSSRPEPLFHTSVAKMPDGMTRDLLGLKKTFDVFNIYIGLGANTKNGLYFNLPKFIKRSPFNLIFRDLTGGELPKITKDNIFFQLLDYDVA
jgi:hypothetical protein